MEITLENRDKIITLLNKGICPICGRSGFKVPLTHITRTHDINRVEFKNLIMLGQRNGFLDSKYREQKQEHAERKNIISQFKNKPNREKRTTNKAINYSAKKRYQEGKIKLNKGNPDTNSIKEAQNKPIMRIDSKGSITEYGSITEAAKEHDLTITAISNCLRGKSKSSAGYKWKYTDK